MNARLSPLQFICEYREYFSVSEIARFAGHKRQTFEDILRDESRHTEEENDRVRLLLEDMRNKLNKMI